MNEHWIVRAYNRFRPRQGWLPLVLLAGALGCLAFSVLEVEWVPRDGVVVATIALGFLAAALMAQRRGHPALAWAVLLLGGAALSVVLVAELLPPWRVVTTGWPALLDFWQNQAALFADRVAGWARAVRSGGRSTETIVFSLGLALAGWLVAAFLAWSSYRLRQPYVGLTLVGFALAVNTFYGQAGLYWAVIFFGLAVTAGTYLNYLYREGEWERTGLDYSDEVRLDLLIYAAGVSLGIMSLAMALPSINFRAIAEAFQRQEAVVEAEQGLARAFAGVRQPRTDEGAIGAGGLPRSFLLGGDPGLTETVVMTATVRPVDDEAGLPNLAAVHWRSVSYDVYTGRGWSRSPEREQAIAREQPIAPEVDAPGPNVQAVELVQEVHWLYDRRATRYTVGRPLVFSHDVFAQWRGTADLVGVRGRNNAPFDYAARTRAVVADPAGLRAARLEDVPPEIRARYTALPSSVPGRVYDLAHEAAGLAAGTAAPSAYDQARAIEMFLHQYPYTLDLPPPPANVDIVDYFLFDLQRGFCDYYASAMVVMARAVGLPARLGVGFLQQPADAAGVQTVRQINAHSWAEVYFAGYGWVEFEPTAPFAAPAAPADESTTAPAPAATYEPPVGTGVAIPPRAPRRATPWLWLVGAAALALVAWRLWGRRLAARAAPRAPLDDVQAAFARLEEGAAALGYVHRPGQTPAEFTSGLLGQLDALTDSGDEAAMQPAVERLGRLFAARQYGRAASPTDGSQAQAAWRDVRGPLRRLVWRRRLRRGQK
ncbi:transglutaminase domain-containing protein [Promineifilum sp.]|uniref:transglutaminase domain-containing protein n=1 Tax=Promineifilum sp. TaxID=2664178 RepID=UPI0035AF788E